MYATSLGYDTDLMLLSQQGSTITQMLDYTVIRTPDNPTFWWGNFLLYPRAPGRGELATWVEAFGDEFPSATHLAIGVDAKDTNVEPAHEHAELELLAEASTVMTATAVHPPPRPNTDAVLRRLETDADWIAATDLRALDNTEHEPRAHRVFLDRKMRALRSLSEPVGAGSARSSTARCVPGWASSPMEKALRGSTRSTRTGTFGAEDSRGRSCITSASTRSASSAPRRWS